MFEKIKKFFNYDINKINDEILLELQETMKDAEKRHEEVYRWKEDYKKLYSKYKEKNEELLVKEKVLDANNEVAKILSNLKEVDYKEKIDKVLEILGNKLNVDRCYIYRYNREESTFDLYLQWRTEQVLDKFSKQDPLFWLDIFSRKQIICGDIEHFTVEEKENLRPQQVESICLVPIFIFDHFWGFMGFDSCIEKRKWFFEEECALQNTADMIGMAISSKAIFDKMVEKKTLLEESLNISGIYMWRKNLNGVYIDGNEFFNNHFFNNEVDLRKRTIDFMSDILFESEEHKKEWKEMVSITDNIALQNGKEIHFYEIYKKENGFRILDVIKNPKFSQKNWVLEGLIGIGDDKTSEASRILGMIKNSNTIKSVYEGENVQAYQVTNADKI